MGTTDALPCLHSKECTDDGKAQRTTERARCCQPCHDFCQSKWENTKKSLIKKNFKKFGALLDVLLVGRETLSVTDESTLRSITPTGDQHLGDQGQQLKQHAVTGNIVISPEDQKSCQCSIKKEHWIISC